jgi:hypothetical protein
MKTVAILIVLAMALGLFVGLRSTQSSAVKVCRADARRFAQENASYEAEYDSLYGATMLAQRPITELLARDQELMDCIGTDPSNRDEYKAVLYRIGFIEGGRFLKFMLDTHQMQDFADYERGQQEYQLAKYREK